MSRKEHATEVLATLSYYGQIHGVIDVRDVRHSRYYCDEGPVGAIALSLVAVSLDAAYTYVC